MRKPILSVLIGYLLASVILVTAQGTGWRIRQGTTEIFVGTVARPQTDGTDFGTTTFRWDIFAGTLNIDDVLTTTSYFAAAVGTDCTAATIGYSYTGDTNTGITAVAADQLDFCLGGALEARLTATAFTPGTSDGNALGTVSLMWADLFLALGGVINFDNGDVTLTHAANLLTISGGDVRFDGQVVVGGVAPADASFSITGTFSASSAKAFMIDATVAPNSNSGGFGIYSAPTFTEAGIGTHVIIANMYLATSSVTVGDAFVTDTASLYIAGAMSATVTGANYAIWSDVGVNRFDGPVITGSQSVDLDAVTTFAATASYVVLTCTGAETLNTITLTGVATGTILDIQHGDTDCTIADDDDVTAANAIDLTGTATNDLGAINKIISVRRASGGYWLQIAESDN